MFKENRRRYFFIGFLALLFSLAFFMGQVQPVVAQENVTPTFTETPSPEITESPFVENSQTPSNTPEATSTLTPTPTLTNTLEALLEVPKIKGDYVEDEIIVRFAPSTGDAQAAASVCFVNEQVEISSEIAALGASLLKISSGSVAEAIARAENCPHILFAEPNYYLYAVDTVPNDPNWVNQYGLNNIRAPQGWDTTTGSASVVIAIVDTGVDLTHPDLASKIIAGYDFVNNDAVAQDDNGHGSHVAGIAAAASNNAAGVAGTSWGARIMPVKVLNASKSGTFANAAAGIIWATDHGAHIINLSLGGNSHSAIFQNAIDYAYGNGVVIVAASGNAGNGFVLYPARYANVIAVGATNAGNNRAAFSNYGAELDLVAPGDAIYSTGINTYFYDSGTSMSAPYVSGLAAILRGIPGSGSPANIAWAMKITALDLGIAGRDDLYGSGLIQMDAAIQLLWPTSTPTPTSTQTVSSSGQTGFGFGSGSPNAEATLTPTATSTQIAIASPTLLATITLFPSPDAKTSPEPELFALSTPARVEDSAQEKNNDYILPCLGSFLILFGIFLLWLGFRLKKKKNKLF